MFGMRSRSLQAIGLLLAVLLTTSAAPLRAADEGEALPGLDGGRLSVSDLSEGQFIIVVWASWSPRSRNIGARVGAVAERWGERARVVTVNFQESREKAREFARKQGLRAPVFLDTDATFARRYAVTSLPFLLVLDDGKVAYSGRLPADPDPVIDRALG